MSQVQTLRGNDRSQRCVIFPQVSNESIRRCVFSQSSQRLFTERSVIRSSTDSGVATQNQRVKSTLCFQTDVRTVAFVLCVVFVVVTLCGGAVFAQTLLSPKLAFRYTATATNDALTVNWAVDSGHYLYRDRMRVDSLTNGVQFELPAYPQGEVHTDEFFGDTVIFRDRFSVVVPFHYASSSPPEQFEVQLVSQGCNASAGVCYPKQQWTLQMCRNQNGFSKCQR